MAAAEEMPPEGVLRAIVQAGLHAPSAENRHFLRFDRDGNALWVLATDCASWPAHPDRAWLAHVSLGAVVENMALRAAAQGWVQQCSWLPQSAPRALARLTWWPRDVAAVDALDQAIEHRHTNRRFYRRGQVPSQVLARVADAAACVQGARFVWLEAPALRATALRLLRRAETERFRRRHLHEELFSAIRFEVGWRASCAQGLAPGALQIEPGLRAAFAALRHWPVMRAATWLGLHHALGLRAAFAPCALAPHLGVVLAQGESAVDDSSAGRALQRVWLAATREGLALQPFAAPVALTRQPSGEGYVSGPTKARLQDDLQRLANALGARPCMFLRLGHAAAPDVRSGRSAVEQHLGG